MTKIINSLLLCASLSFGDVLFHKESVSLGVAVGSGSIDFGDDTQNYFIAGASGDYFIFDDFSIGLGILHWMGDDPTLTEYTISLTYYMNIGKDVFPYGGVFYRYNDYRGGYSFGGMSIEPDDYNSVGFKVGAAYKVSFGYLGLGMVNEYNVDDSENTVYPEFVIGIVF